MDICYPIIFTKLLGVNKLTDNMLVRVLRLFDAAL